MKTKTTLRRAATAGKRPGAEKKAKAPRKDPKRLDRWDWHRRTLLALRERLSAEARELRATNSGLLNPEVADFADAAESRSGRELVDAELRTEENLLEEVEAALRRLDRGTYGICETSGRPILPSRLRAVPWTRFNRPMIGGKGPAAGRAKREKTP